MKVGSTDVLLDILDTAGHEEYSAMLDQYCRTADVLLIMYSVTNKQSFDNVRKVCVIRLCKCKSDMFVYLDCRFLAKEDKCGLMLCWTSWTGQENFPAI